MHSLRVEMVMHYSDRAYLGAASIKQKRCESSFVLGGAIRATAGKGQSINGESRTRSIFTTSKRASEYASSLGHLAM